MVTYLIGCFVATLLLMLILGNLKFELSKAIICILTVLFSWVSVVAYSILGLYILFAPGELLDFLYKLEERIEKIDEDNKRHDKNEI